MTIAVPRGEHGKANVLNHLPKMASGFYGIGDGGVCIGHGACFLGRWVKVGAWTALDASTFCASALMCRAL